mmetsp:Transcript_45178/g.79538  ORF Transcript_45178/g.79538 Transcript_45178/m.79538 type:complete len:341 (+) Transcript_45178:69-1091(+)
MAAPISWYHACGNGLQQPTALPPSAVTQLAWVQAGAPHLAATPGQHAAYGWPQDNAAAAVSGCPWMQPGTACQFAATASEGPAPMDPALAHLVQQVGIEPWELDDFCWIAEYGLQESVVPQHWSMHRDVTSGLAYYVERETQVTTWESPLAPCLRRVVEAGRLFLQKPSDDLFEEQKVLLWHHHKEQLDSWHGPLKDDEGRSYFVNSATGVSSWEDPRLKTQYMYDLEVGLLESLQEFLQPSPCQSDPAALDSPSFGGQQVDKPRRFGGAEVLTLECGSPKCHNDFSDEEEQERLSALRKMGSAAKWLQDTTATEREVQRRQMMRKAQARRQRKLQEQRI